MSETFVAEARPSYTVERSKHVPVSRVIGTDPAAIAQAIQVVELVEEGALLKHALEKAGMLRKMFLSALNSQRELSVRLARAMEFSADFLVDEAIDAARNEPDVMRARVIAENNRWAASKRNSKRYGDRIDLNVTQTLDISGTLQEAKLRMLRPVSDQEQIEDAQVLDAQAIPTLGAPDNQSAGPDIFGGDHVQAPAAESGGDEVDIFS